MTPEILDQVISRVGATNLPTDLPFTLKEEWPDLHFTLCYDDDVCGPKPVHEDPRFNVYLVASGESCIGFTPSVQAATGVVIAEIEPED